MKKTINVHDFVNEFKAYDREHHFSRAGLEALFDELEKVDQEWELDVIALCCDYSEAVGPIEYLKENYMSDAQFAEEFLTTCPHCGEGLPNDVSICPDCKQDLKADLREQCLEYLYHNTHVIEFNGGIIIASF